MPYTAITHDSRHPFETHTLFAAVIGGSGAVFGGLWPSSIEAVFSLWVQSVWGIAFGGGALMALVGIHITKRDTGIFLEQIGLMSLAGSCLTYGAALLIFNFSGGFAISAFLFLVATACIKQWWRLEKFIRETIAHGARIRRARNGR